MPPRVLLIGPEWVAGWAESTAQALSGLNCTVKVFHYLHAWGGQEANQWQKRLTNLLRRKGQGVPWWVRAAYWRWVGLRIGKPLIKVAQEFRPDVVLVLKGEIFHPDLISEVKRVTGASLVTWWQDDPFALERQHGWTKAAACLPIYDCVGIFDRRYMDQLKDRGVRKSIFLPCAADPALFHPQKFGEKERRACAAVVSFVGVYFDLRGVVVNELLDEPGFRVWGPGWEWFFTNHFGNKKPMCWGGDVLRPEQISKVYSSSSININVHHPQSQLAGLNNRAFEIPAAGGFQLMDHVQGMEELLEPGREVAVYKTPKEVPELVRRYLQAPEERLRIARAGHERVLAQHTYRHRMSTVLNSL